MGEYILNAEATRVVNRNEKGSVTYRRRYKRGDVVDVSKIDEAQVQRLIESGYLVPKGEAEDDGEGSGTTEGSEGSGDATSGLVDTPSTAASLGSTGTQDEDPESDEERPDGSEDSGEVEEEDFESYDYPTLQRLAKERTGDGSGGKQDLIDRLKRHASASE